MSVRYELLQHVSEALVFRKARCSSRILFLAHTKTDHVATKCVG